MHTFSATGRHESGWSETATTFSAAPAFAISLLALNKREGVNRNMWSKLNQAVLSLMTRVQIRKEEGQALVEYALILALISVVAIGALTAIGTNVTTKLTEVGEAIANAA